MNVNKSKLLKDFEIGEIKIALSEEQIKHLYEFIKNALEKQIPKKAIAYTNYAEHLKIGNCYWGGGTTVYRCPNCNEFVSRGFNCCCDCGQALDWSDSK